MALSFPESKKPVQTIQSLRTGYYYHVVPPKFAGKPATHYDDIGIKPLGITGISRQMFRGDFHNVHLLIRTNHQLSLKNSILTLPHQYVKYIKLDTICIIMDFLFIVNKGFFHSFKLSR
jgi:hypothetical protein